MTSGGVQPVCGMTYAGQRRGIRVNAKRITSQDVAQRAGVSRTTVSVVLNDAPGVQISEETRQRVLQAARELGYVPDAAAQALAGRRAQVIGLVLTHGHHLRPDWHLAEMLKSLIDAVHRHSMRLMVDQIEEAHQQEAILRLVRARYFDGLLLAGPHLDSRALWTLKASGFPAVLLGMSSEAGLCSVDIDQFAAAKTAVNHLISLGHHRIVCITHAPLSIPSAVERLAGYRKALEEAGLPYSAEFVRQANFDPHSGYTQMQQVLELNPLPTAVFAASDLVALGALAAIREHRLKIPDDIALVGFDDIPLARYLDPPLTTVHVPVPRLAQAASEILIRIIGGDEPCPEAILLDTYLEVRDSSGASRC